MPSASGAFARRRPGRRGVVSRARACEAALAAVARRASSDACPTVASIRQSRAAARRACEDIAGDPNGRRGGRRRRVGRWGGIGGDNRYGGWARARLPCRAFVGRDCAVRSAARGARRPSATAAERRATGITYSCIAHRSSRGRGPRAARSASCVRFVCRLGESMGEMTNEPAGETVSESMGETAARTGWRIGSARRADGRVGRVGRAYRTRVSNAHAGSARRFSPSNRAHAFARCPACAISRHS